MKNHKEQLLLCSGAALSVISSITLSHLVVVPKGMYGERKSKCMNDGFIRVKIKERVKEQHDETRQKADGR